MLVKNASYINKNILYVYIFFMEQYYNLGVKFDKLLIFVLCV